MLATLIFESRLRASPDEVWRWITSVEGISKEMWPFFRMTAPPNVKSLADVTVKPGERLFRSRIWLFGMLPIDHSDLTLLELTVGDGFVEESPMGSMKLWRHERRLQNHANVGALTLTDRLTFEPKHAKTLVTWFIGKTFEHRHAVLRAHFGVDDARASREARG